MDDLRTAILELVRLGVTGDTESVRMYGRRLLRRLGPDGDPAFRQRLQALVMSGSRTRTLRGTSLRENSVLPDQESDLRLLRIQDEPRLPAPLLEQSAQDVITKLLDERS